METTYWQDLTCSFTAIFPQVQGSVFHVEDGVFPQVEDIIHDDGAIFPQVEGAIQVEGAVHNGRAIFPMLKLLLPVVHVQADVQIQSRPNTTTKKFLSKKFTPRELKRM